jgi:hypothetical protein
VRKRDKLVWSDSGGIVRMVRKRDKIVRLGRNSQSSEKKRELVTLREE